MSHETHRQKAAREAKEKKIEGLAYARMSMLDMHKEIDRLKAFTKQLQEAMATEIDKRNTKILTLAERHKRIERGLMHEIKEANRALDMQTKKTSKLVNDIEKFIREMKGPGNAEKG